tara:strand:- start:6738 stop:7934 length:1197 start_codon:yes stop_codon:yes gene_type:complete
MKCKITGKKLKPFMSFGKMPIANGFLHKKDFKKEFFFNMEVGFSKKLSLFQINEHPKPEQMFNKTYPFFTGSSLSMIKHFKSYADWIIKNYSKNLKYLVEIGSNDGTFLLNFKKKNIKIYGYEPSKNVANLAKRKGINTINNFFNLNSVKSNKKIKNKVNIICAANAICHIPDLKNLIKSVDYLLGEEGLFIFEEPYLGSMYKKGSYDQIYDEHIFIFSVSSIKKIFELFNFELIDAIPQITHGGSMRYVISRKGRRKIKNNVNKILKYEKKYNIDNIKGCLKFKSKCERSKKNLIKKLKNLKKNNKTIAGYAATSKSTTVFNYCNINNKLIDFICDTTKEKIGKFSPGTHIPIVSMKHFYNNLPDIVYLLAWNHKKEIFKKEKKIFKKVKWISHVKL